MSGSASKIQQVAERVVEWKAWIPRGGVDLSIQSHEAKHMIVPDSWSFRAEFNAVSIT